MSRPRCSIAICLAITAVVLLSASQDPPPTGAGSQGGGAAGRRGGPAPGGAPIGGTLTPRKPDERGWGWQVKALMNPATPRPLYNRAKEALFNDRQITSYTISSFDSDLYCEVGKHFDYIWFEMQHSTMSWDEVRRMIAACPKVGAAPMVRMPDALESSIQKATDLGAIGLIFPTMRDGNQALEAARYSRFPPFGRRSSGSGQAGSIWSGVPGGYQNTYNDNVLVVVMLETLDGIINADEIANTFGVDVVIQGNNDLSRFSGWSQTDPRYQSLLTVSRNATLHAGKFWGNAGAQYLTGFTTARGALPVKIGDEVIGAVGVSGAPGGEKDEACVQTGLDKVKDKLN